MIEFHYCGILDVISPHSTVSCHNHNNPHGIFTFSAPITMGFLQLLQYDNRNH